MKQHLKFYSSDPGYCRIYYKAGPRLYCVQEEAHSAYEFYICSSEGEPDHPVSVEGRTFQPIPNPSEYERGFMAWLEGKGVLLAESVQ